MVPSAVCIRVCKFLDGYVNKIKDCLDGKNVEAVLTELGVRFHRTIYDHLQQFQISSVGAMFVICDMNEYRRCVSHFKVPLLAQLFDTLHALCNLLVVAPENLKQICVEDQLAVLDKATLISFIQLRADYKSAKLINLLK
ncbi:Exocyst complex component 5 [Halotydeus destructor]|nr:Exocyst complex component 5 [Halotydeus destructor]